MSSDALYSAVYSGVPVYEFINPKSSVMRRKKDGWINATHILKVADFPKAKRTRILERDVQIDVHEKVQGGYGKYQGTWVPMERAKDIAVRFAVLDELKPLFDYRSTGGANSPPPAPKHHHATSGTSKKNKAAAAKAARSNTAPAGSSRLNDKIVSPTPVQTKTSSITVLKSASATDRRRTLKPPVRTQSNIPTTTLMTHSQSMNLSESESDFDDSDSISGSNLKEGILNQSGPNNNGNKDSTSPSEFLSDTDLDQALQQTNNFSTQLRRTQQQQQQQQQQQSHQQHLQQHQEQNQQQNQQSHQQFIQEQIGQQQNLDQQQEQLQSTEQSKEWYENNQKSRTQKLLEYFLSTEDNMSNNIKVPSFITDPHSDFDINQVIDRDGNTTFHWACAMGDLKMCDALLTRGCNYRALNNEGQVPIMRSVLYTNSYSRRTFAKLLDLLRDSLLDSDSRGRTILHHIGFSTASNNNLPSARYYTEILLTKVAETVQPMERIINFINQQDHDGNTALHIMGHNSAKKCIRVLMGYNARVDIPNNRNEFVSDYLYNNSVFEPSANPVISNAQISHGQETEYNNNLNKSTQHPNHNNNNNNNESFSYMRPFNPSLNYHNPVLSQQFSVLNASNYLTVPHYSEAAMQVNQKSFEILERLGELSNAFDVELQSRDSDIKELDTILSQMDDDIKKTDSEIEDILQTVLKSENNELPISEKLNLVKTELTALESEYLTQTGKLEKLIERSQAKDLATEVQECETEKLKELDIKSEAELKPSEYNVESMKLVLDLIILQITRKRTVDELVNLYADASENTEVIGSYRRLVSSLSNVPIDEVDDSLNDIEDCLKNDEL
ncbi:hypothetical protein CANARDRAFT_27628 [[Candida] arabinofermentans NRRL YB-2248]|uniref:Transcription factor MBP1 n=1 Tax=[Candida] arabinofermentans NRRL YB-2248 TaxID=983967 RepID=A0A1E4T3S7_9ASCO|nr:hypothetical protein CANARDRAFT_27628 [[Candida] arabinofermentans NRRL YB-2248]